MGSRSRVKDNQIKLIHSTVRMTDRLDRADFQKEEFANLNVPPLNVTCKRYLYPSLTSHPLQILCPRVPTQTRHSRPHTCPRLCFQAHVGTL